MATKQGKELLQAIRNTKSAAKRDGYDQILYLANDGTYTIHRLYYGVKKYLWDVKEIIGFAVYSYVVEQANYYSMKNKSEKAKSICSNLIKVYELQ